MDRFIISHVTDNQIFAILTIEDRLYGYPACRLELGRGISWQDICCCLSLNHHSELYCEGQERKLRNRATAFADTLAIPRHKCQTELRQNLQNILLCDPQNWTVVHYDSRSDRELRITLGYPRINANLLTTLEFTLPARLKVERTL